MRLYFMAEMHTRTHEPCSTPPPSPCVGVCWSSSMLYSHFFRWCTLQRKRKKDLEQKKRFMLYSSLLYPPLSDTIFFSMRSINILGLWYDTDTIRYDILGFSDDLFLGSYFWDFFNHFLKDFFGELILNKGGGSLVLARAGLELNIAKGTTDQKVEFILPK